MFEKAPLLLSDLTDGRYPVLKSWNGMEWNEMMIMMIIIIIMIKKVVYVGISDRG